MAIEGGATEDQQHEIPSCQPTAGNTPTALRRGEHRTLRLRDRGTPAALQWRDRSPPSPPAPPPARSPSHPAPSATHSRWIPQHRLAPCRPYLGSGAELWRPAGTHSPGRALQLDGSAVRGLRAHPSGQAGRDHGGVRPGRQRGDGRVVPRVVPGAPAARSLDQRRDTAGLGAALSPPRTSTASFCRERGREERHRHRRAADAHGPPALGQNGFGVVFPFRLVGFAVFFLTGEGLVSHSLLWNSWVALWAS